MGDVIDILKEAGLPFNYAKEDLHINEKFDKLTIYLHDLKSEACIEIVNNLHGQEKSGKKLSVYALVEDSPTKQLGKELEALIHDEVTPAKESVDNTPTKSSNTTVLNSTSLITPIVDSVTFSAQINNPPECSIMLGDLTNLKDPELSKFWAGKMGDLEMSDDSSDDDEEALRNIFKRKAVGSPDKHDFNPALSRKQKKKLKQILNKSN